MKPLDHAVAVAAPQDGNLRLQDEDVRRLGEASQAPLNHRPMTLPEIRLRDQTSINPAEEVTRFLNLMVEPDQVFEVRSPKASQQRGGDFKATYSGYFAGVIKAADAILQLDHLGVAPAIYLTLNPCQPDLMCREQTNTLLFKAQHTTQDSEIVNRRWMLLDFDPKRPAGTSSSDGELQAALDKAQSVVEYLGKNGFPEPVLAVSGNGVHALYRVDLPADDDGLIKGVLQSLAKRFSDDQVDLDTTVHNPSRITKVIGTMTRKGTHAEGVDGIEDRPHRRSYLLNPAVQPQLVPKELLEKIVALPEPMTISSLAKKENRSPANSERLPKIEPIVEGCGFMKHCHDDAAGLMEPEWYGMLSILGYCEDGERLAREWSSPHPSYKEDETQRKLEQAMDKAGPRTCQDIHGSLGFAGCESCPLKGKIKSPISLGYRDSEPEEAQSESNEVFAMTDLGNARCFVREYSGKFLWVPSWKSWLAWDGRRWKSDDGNVLIHQAVFRLLEEVMPAFAESMSSAQRREFDNHLERSQAQKQITSLIGLAKPLLAVNISELDSDPMLFNCKSGTIDLRTGKCRTHDPTDKITLYTDCEVDSDSEPVRWNQFISEVFADSTGSPRPELESYVQRALGYSLTGDVSEQCLFMCHGSGANGKTTFMSVIQKMLGEYGHTADEAVMLSRQSKANSDEIAELCGKRFVVTSEPDKKERLNESRVKQLTGSGRLRAMRKFESAFEFDPTHKLWMDTNYAPRMTGSDFAMQRRVHKISFDRKFVDASKAQLGDGVKDPNLAKALEAELPAILNWILAGVKAWQSNGLNPPEVVVQATEDYMAENDPIGRFLTEEAFDKPDSKVTVKDIYRHYVNWADREGIKHMMAKNTVAKELASRGYESCKYAGERAYSGLEFFQEEPSVRDPSLYLKIA